MARPPRTTLDQLAHLDLETLKPLWSKTFGSSPPEGAKRELLIRLLAHGLQERAHEPLSRATRKSLLVRATPSGDHAQGISVEEGVSTLRIGARLVRSWNGATHEVTVLDRGFAYRGKPYRSLSEIAEAITGAHWSGPRFFGLKKSRSKPERASA